MPFVLSDIAPLSISGGEGVVSNKNHPAFGGMVFQKGAIVDRISKDN